MTLPVSHYLEIYKRRQAMAQQGITEPNEAGRKLFDRLVERLSGLEPGLPVHLVREPGAGGEWIAFMVQDQELGRLWVAEWPAQASAR